MKSCLALQDLDWARTVCQCAFWFGFKYSRGVLPAIDKMVNGGILPHLDLCSLKARERAPDNAQSPGIAFAKISALVEAARGKMTSLVFQKMIEMHFTNRLDMHLPKATQAASLDRQCIDNCSVLSPRKPLTLKQSKVWVGQEEWGRKRKHMFM